MGDTRTKDQKAADAVIAYEKTILAAKRRLRLTKAHDDLISFTELMMPDPSDPDDANLSRYKPSKHHQVIAAALQEVEKGNILRLIITMPPRAGKSELSSKKFIPWLMGRDPYKHVIFASYNETFAQDTGRAVRDLMKQNLYKQVFHRMRSSCWLCRRRPRPDKRRRHRRLCRRRWIDHWSWSGLSVDR